MARVVAVCVSEHKGERKKNVNERMFLENLGLEGDAHAGFQHRQVSLLALESINKMRQQGLDVGPGDFAENLTVEGIDLVALPVGTRLRVGKDVILRVTQIGKECQHRCAIYYQAGDCVMPREGVFAEVLLGGYAEVDDAITFQTSYRIGVVTASDKGARGAREDVSGLMVQDIVRPFGDVVQYEVVPDEQDVLADTMRRMIDEEKVDLLLTTGGTGFGPRDVTPEATLQICDRLIPGIPEAMRAESMKKTPKAMLSRATAGIRKQTIIINLPGSPRGVRENLEVVLPVLNHALEIATDRGGECGSNGMEE